MTATMLERARAAEAEVAAVLREHAFTNLAAVAWAEDDFDRRLREAHGQGYKARKNQDGGFSNYMAELRDTQCWRNDHYFCGIRHEASGGHQ